MRTWLVVLWGINLGVWIMAGNIQAQETSEEVRQEEPEEFKQEELEELEFQDIEDLNLEELLDITISIAAGRVQRLEEAPGIVTVITDEDIQRIGARTLADVLEIVPGFEVLINRLGLDRIVVRGVGAFEGVFINSENVLILFNGHRLNEEFYGGATMINLEIPMYNVKRVEIIRGPGSALFGADAFVGVINIVTYTAEDFEGFRISGGRGSFNSQEYSLLFGHIFEDLSLSGSVQYTDTDGPQLFLREDWQTLIDQSLARGGFPPASRAPGNTIDHRRTGDVHLQAAYKGLALHGRVRDENSGGFIGIAGILGEDTELDTRQILFDASYRYSLGKEGSLLGKFSFTQNETQSFLEVSPPESFLPKPYPYRGFYFFPMGVLVDVSANSRRWSEELILDYPVFEGNQLTLGLSFEKESTFDQETWANFEPDTLAPLPSLRALPEPLVPDKSRDIFSMFVQNIWNPLPRLGLTLGLRYDHYSDFGDTFDPRVGVVWNPARDVNVKLLYGTAFRAPTFGELSSNFYNFYSIMGNPDLEPSTIQTFEAALGYTFQRKLRISANYFANVIRDFIVMVWEPTGPMGTYTFINGEDIEVRGAEFELNASFSQDVSGFFNYTYQHPKYKEIGERLPDVPAHLANLGVTVGIGKHFCVTPTLLIRGIRPRRTDDDREDVAGYALINVNVQAKNLFKTLEISAMINNLLDTDYVDPDPKYAIPDDFPRPGRSVFIKATYTF